MKQNQLLLAGMIVLGLVACQGNESPAPTVPAESEATTQAQPPANDVRDVKQSGTSPVAGMEKQTESTGMNEVVKEASQTEAQPATTAAAPTTSMSEPAAAAPKSTAPAPATTVAETPKPTASALPAGDAASGEKIAGKCKACHNFTDKKKVGPGLAGVFGRKAGQMPDMNYSASLKQANWVWDAAHLAAWVCSSADAVKVFTGDAAATTKMPPQRICDPQKQADLIAFLKTL